MATRRTCALAAAWAFTCVLTVRVAASQQQSPSTPAAGDDGAKLPVSLDRIRQGLDREPKLKLDFLDPNIPLFRIAVREKPLKLEDYWKVGPDTAVSRDVRPSFASTWHHDFLSMTTPPQQRAASVFGILGNPVHPVGPPVLEIAKGIKKVFSNVERGRIRRQIQEELKAIEANQARQEKPSPQQPQQTQPPPQGTEQSEETRPGSNGSASKPVPNDPR